MDRNSLKEQVETLRQAFSYIDRFQNSTFVIKIDGSLMTDPNLPILIKDIAQLQDMGIRVVIVPGTRERIDEILGAFKVKCPSVKGVRITTPEAIPFIKMAAFDISNKIMTMLAENHANAVIGNWVRARGYGVIDGVDFQHTGMVDKVDTDLLNKVIEDDMIPIFPNIGWSVTGKPYNINSNDLAMSIATALKASKLFFLTEFGGISSAEFKVPESAYISGDGVISQLTLSEAGAFVDANKKSLQDSEQAQLVELGRKACSNGVERVHIVNGHVDGMLLKEIFSNRGFGTMIYANQHEDFRAMVHTDIPGVLSIMEHAIEAGILLPRSTETLEAQLSDYVVYEVDGTIHACGALHSYSDKSAEIAGIAVDEQYAKLGIGRKLITYLMELSAKKKIKKLFLLTTQTADWFESIGFKVGSVDDLPPEKREKYNAKRNSRVMVYGVVAKRK